ncbi:MAG: DUF1002 domain-containing protein [Bacillaceae bacterium]
MKKIASIIMLCVMIFTTCFNLGPQSVLADAVDGEVVVSLGRDLTSAQQAAILEEFGVDNTVRKIEITIEDEFRYLGEELAKKELGKRSLSSAKITLAKKGTGIVVTTKNVTMVTPDMYRNALITAGVQDAIIDVTAPSPVSGTAALTGIMKAYESQGFTIKDDVKQVANQEIIETAKLGDEVGKEQANNLISSVKEEIAQDMPKNATAMKKLVQEEAQQLNVSLSDEQLKRLTDLFMNMKEANINWDSVKNALEKAKEKLNQFADSEEGKAFFESIKDFFISAWNWIKDAFQSIFA